MSKFSLFFQVINYLRSLRVFNLFPTNDSNAEEMNRSYSSQPLNVKQQQHCFPREVAHNSVKLTKEEANIVIEKLGIFSSDDDGDQEALDTVLGEEEISKLLEEEFSLEEVKRAFDVFDENKDGFISARELQKVIDCLGLEKESELDKFQRMILAVDENGDGKVDFNDFMKLIDR